ncbi:hypothetical protein JTB14_014702 [Gonioctena quinquepunctata]|nr:hypothetical protein JTB14_014702 [Gonioctena quinquepunctata]
MDLDPATKSRIEMKLYRNVKNVELLRKKLMKEILFNLSISKNISRSLETFDENGACNIYDQIIGDEVPLQELSDLCDVHLMKKIYKISDMEFNVVPLLDSITVEGYPKNMSRNEIE